MQKKGKLELTWIGKYDEEKPVAPRILLEDTEKSYGNPSSENMLIHGDNLIALQALQQNFAEKIKCIYIDPPFNTGPAFENYDDNLEMFIWLNLMKRRLQLLHSLLRDDGTLFVHIDDSYLPYLTILLDEIFGRSNRLYLVTFKQGSATGHKAINPGMVTTNFVLVYSKVKAEWNPNRIFTDRGGRDKRYGNYIENIEDNCENWRITTSTEAFASSLQVSVKEARVIIKNEPQKIDEFVRDHCESVIQLGNPDYKSVGATTKEFIDKSNAEPDRIFVQKRDGLSDIILIRGKRIIFYKNKLKKIDGRYVTGEPLTTLWDDLLSNNLYNEGGVDFPKGKNQRH